MECLIDMSDIISEDMKNISEDMIKNIRKNS